MIFYLSLLIVFQFKAVGENYYEFLGVSLDASQEEITKAVRRIVQKWHPDKNSDPKASEMFKKARNIYETLSDPRKKAEYDLSLKESLSEETSSEKNFGDVHISSIEEFLARYPIAQVREEIVHQITDLKQLKIIMADPDPQVRIAVVRRARTIPKGMTIISILSNDPEVSVRSAVVMSIGRMQYDYNDIINEMIIEGQIDKFMEDPSLLIKQHLLSVLVFVYDELKKPEKAIMRFKTFMKDPDPKVRRVVAEEIGRMKDKKQEVIEILNILKNDSESEVKKGVITGAISLAQLSTTEKMFFNYIMKDIDPAVREYINNSTVEIFGDLKIKNAVEEILDYFMEDPDPSVRVHIASKLVGIFGNLTIRSVVERLKVLMKDTDSQVREEVARIAGRMGSEKESAKEILDYLKNDFESEVKREVAESAGRMGSEKEFAKEMLNYLKNNADSRVKKGVITGALILGESSIIEEMLTYFMKDPDPSVREYVADNIIGRDGRLNIISAVKKLRVLMRDPNSEVQTAVARSAGRMVGERRAARKILHTLSKNRESRVVDQTFRSALFLEGRRGMNFIYRRLRGRENSNEIFKENRKQLDAKEKITEALKSGGKKAERVLDHFMADPDPAVRVHIANKLVGIFGELTIKSAVERLKVLMKDSNSEVRTAVAVSVGGMKGNKKSAKEILKYLKDDSNLNVQKAVITSALKLGGTFAEEILGHFMEDPNPSVREHIARAIYWYYEGLKIKNVFERLKVLMKDPDSQVRERVAESVGRIGSEKESAEEILNYLKDDPSLQVQKAVITGAINLGGPLAEEILNHFMKPPDLQVKRDVITTGAEKLGGSSSKEILNYYNMQVQKDAVALDSSIRVRIAHSIIGHSGELKIKSAVEKLKVFMKDPNPEVREAAAKSAGRMRSEKESAGEILNYLKNDPNLQVKRGVIIGAVELGGDLAEEILDHFMKDPDPSVRMHITNRIVSQFRDLKVKSVVERLKVLMRDSDSGVRKAVARSVGRMRSEKESAEEILIVLGNDKEFSIVVEVVQSALSLGRETALAVLTSIVLNNKTPQVQEYIGSIVKEYLGRKTYKKLLDNSCASSLSAN